MYQLASITLNRVASEVDILVFPSDILYVEELSGGGSRVVFRDGRDEKVTEAVSAIQTSINALWDEYIAALGDPT